MRLGQPHPDGLPAASLPLRLPRWTTLPLDSGDDENGKPAHAGAALAVLDGAIATGVPFAGVWTKRLALSAAAAAMARMGRPEDEAALRDLVALGPEVPAGPAAPVVRAYLWLAAGGAGDRWTDLPELIAGLGARSGSAPDDLAQALEVAKGAPCPLAAANAAARAVEAVRPGRDALALWAADATLARWLGWPCGLPLVTLGVRAGVRAGVSGSGTFAEAGAEHRLAAAVLRGSVRAVNRCAALSRRAAALQAVQPRLRAQSAGRVIERLLSHDALSVAAVRDLIAERAARRLFDRLVALGVVEELTGRTTARLYGL